MWRTRVGYAGGDYANPTYRDLRDQTECFQVDFDPAVIGYAELVDLAFASHNPTWVAHKEQYASLILAHDAQQLTIAVERAERLSAVLGGKKLATRIEPLKRFWNAEDYHQKYYLRNDRTLATDFRAMLGDDGDALRESTSAAHVNGYIAGDGTATLLACEIDSLGLSAAGRARIGRVVGDAHDPIGCSIG